MIIIKTPLRISLGGGGTDLPSYYKKFEGHVVSAAIDKYIYININNTFQKEIILRYLENEKVNSIKKIKHKLFREALKNYNIDSNVEITSTADLPGRSGLGSSGSFLVGLLHSLRVYSNLDVDFYNLAEEACKIEIDKLNLPVGKQDQFIASFGGIRSFLFEKNDNIKIKKIKIATSTFERLNAKSLLFFIGDLRESKSILKDQVNKTNKSNLKIIENLHLIKEIGYKIKYALETGDLDLYSDLMLEHWLLKKERSNKISTNKIDELIKIGLANGAKSAKLIGAGGGGFILFFCNDVLKLRKKMIKLNINEIIFSFIKNGTQRIY
jgi:D-glycero-alpha-D-manno-heptose-7-phosphate kinase